MKRLVVYPYVYIKVFEKKTLLLNLENHEYVISVDDKVSSSFLKLMKGQTMNNFVDSEYLPESFINETINKKMARLDTDNLSSPILQFSSLNFYDKEILFSRSADFIESIKNLNQQPIIIDNIIGEVFDTITVHYSTINLDMSYEMAYKQYPFPQIKSKTKNISLDDILHFLNSFYKFRRLNLIVGDIEECCVHNLSDFIQQVKEKFNCEICLYCLDTSISYVDNLDTLLDNIYVWRVGKGHIHKYQSLYLAMSYADLNEALDDEFCYPCYNSKNLQFIEDILSYSIPELMSLEHTENTICRKCNLNENTYGEITILCDGNVYSDISSHPIGNIINNNCRNVILDELLFYRNWFITRTKLAKCENCIFNELCPSVSKIELCMQKFCFCKK